jgi:arginase
MAMKPSKYTIIEVASELGAGKRGTSLAYAALRIADAERPHQVIGKIPHQKAVDHNHLIGTKPAFEHAKYISDLTLVNENICFEVEAVLATQKFPIIISGDHSNAIGSIAGVKNHFHDKKVGVIWIDAHADLHTPFTTPSGNLHGMPVAVSLGLDNLDRSRNQIDEDLIPHWEKLKRIGNREISPKIDPTDMVFIALRDFEIQEYFLIHDYNMKTFQPFDIKSLGIEDVIKLTIDYLKDCEVIYISFDVDSLDTSISVGTGTPVYNGLQVAEAKQLLAAFMHLPQTKALEITEINPLLDNNNKMAKVVLDILAEVL